MAELRDPDGCGDPDGRGDDRETSPPDLQPPAKAPSPELTPADLHLADRQTREEEEEERLARLRADDELVTEMRKRDFRGPLYEAFEEELVSYAWAVMDGWLRRGYVFELTRDLGRPVPEGEKIRKLLAEDHDEREHLAAGVVGVSVAPFRQRALVKGDWSMTGGASLRTYFMGAVLMSFPNEYRRWHTLQVKWWRQFDAEGRVLQSDKMTDPAVVVTGLAQVADVLRRLKPREQEIVAFHYDDYSHEEIMELTGAESVRAVEGVLYRWRTREKQRRCEGRD